MTLGSTVLRSAAFASEEDAPVLRSVTPGARDRYRGASRIARPESPLRVAIAEDNSLLREGMDKVLTEAGHNVVLKCRNAEDLVPRVGALRPHVVILASRTPRHRGHQALGPACEIRRQLPRIGILILSECWDPQLARDLIDDGPEGVGYLLKDRVDDVANFVDAVGRVACGGSVLDSEVVGMMLGRHRPDDTLASLTDREREVLAAMAEGKSNPGVAESLFISRASVEKHVTAIFRKLNLDSTGKEHRRVQAVLAHLRQSEQR